MREISENQKKLPVSLKVEVRNFDEGLSGSWHSGTVIACEDEFRRIQYDYLFRDDDNSKCVIECVKIPSDNGRSRSCHRGYLRPLPPKVDLSVWSLHYGQCVDVFRQDAWWEGVVFDHEDGSQERIIFLPDIHDEIKAHESDLRITQDWDDIHDDWKPRGDWMFLNIVENIAKEWPFLVSIKQTWYDIQTKNGFRALKEWTSSQRDVWVKLVLEVIIDNFKLTVREFFQKLKSSSKLLYGVRQSPQVTELYKKGRKNKVNVQLQGIRIRGRKRKLCSLDLASCPFLSIKKRKNYVKHQAIGLRDDSEYTVTAPICKDKEGKLASEALCSPSVSGESQETFRSHRLSNEKNPTESCSTSLSSDICDTGETEVKGKNRFEALVTAPKPLKSLAKDSKEFDLNKLRNKLNNVVSDPVSRLRRRAHQAMVPSFTNSKPQNVLSWLIDNNMVLPMTRVHYRCKENNSKLAEGQVTRYGIKCSCCEDTFSLSRFEAHAGAKYDQPSANIYMEDGSSLLECQLQLKRNIDARVTIKEPDKVKDQDQDQLMNDDVCSICNQGGSLVLCDGCPSSFHTGCLGLKEVPSGDWFCPPCCCNICGEGKLNTDMIDFKDSVITCHQCELRTHIGCLKLKSFILDRYPTGIWFCNRSCEQIYIGLQKLLGKSITVGKDNLTWTLLKNKLPDSSNQDYPIVEESAENFSKLNLAIRVMHECFYPFKEPRTGKDLVEGVIFNLRSEPHHLNYDGFYTVLLMRDEELVTVATVRVHGEKFAEIPLVATRFLYRKRGMCRILMNELEKVLIDLGVERLVLPAASSALETWISSFGYSVMMESERSKFMKYNFLGFVQTTFCQKILLRG